ncbi:hypothetical protein GLOIN_2v1752839 [Rhizophagus clarus]|uniref:Uncharacterized protein n=1 Tax=Rhizophagus clarus TaxID=94130 RepID=A0A8H3L1W1_9GLOM|nr:hypothetical protein GLOIN_2v1752839 [Rhizophagus clarus]
MKQQTKLYEFEKKNMLEVEYEVIRDRQLRELELGDELFNKTPVSVRDLRRDWFQIKQPQIFSPNMKFLHYSDFTEKTFIIDGIEGFSERIDLSLVTDIMTVPSPQITSTTGLPSKAN